MLFLAWLLGPGVSDRSALEGRVYLGEDASARLLGRLVGAGGRPAERPPVESLSDRELEVFKLMGQGLTTEQVAEAMHVSPKTVETYRARIKEKLGVSSVNELIRRAVEWAIEGR